MIANIYTLRCEKMFKRDFKKQNTNTFNKTEDILITEHRKHIITRFDNKIRTSDKTLF